MSQMSSTIRLDLFEKVPPTRLQCLNCGLIFEVFTMSYEGCTSCGKRTYTCEFGCGFATLVEDDFLSHMMDIRHPVPAATYQATRLGYYPLEALLVMRTTMQICELIDDEEQERLRRHEALFSTKLKNKALALWNWLPVHRKRNYDE